MAKKKIKLDELVILSYNPRTISNNELDRLKSSIKEHTKAIPEKTDGYRLVSTITVNKQGNRIIGGHQRVRALQELGQDYIYDDDITWVDIEPYSAHEKAMNITLNSDRVEGRWDNDKLDDMLRTIAKEDNLLFESLDLGNIEIEELETVVEEISNKDSLEDNFETDNLEKEEQPEIQSEEEPDVEDDVLAEHRYKDEEGTELKIIEPVENKKNDFQENYDDEEQLFPISYAVTAEQRKSILQSINIAKEKEEFETSSEALEFVSNFFLDNYGK